jgi:hypothetical protein
MEIDLSVWEQRGRNGYWYKIGQPTINPRVVKNCAWCEKECLLKLQRLMQNPYFPGQTIMETPGQGPGAQG